MTLDNIKKLKDQKGFTIVELLIVIVVIAILAAIVIVAYTGVTNRARDSNYRADATSIVKVAETRNADEGSYPSGADTAALTASFNSGDTSNLPSGISINRILSSAAPTDATAYGDDIDDDATYDVSICTGGGITVYYPARVDNAILTTTTGNCP